jgi:hypothetical protein
VLRALVRLRAAQQAFEPMLILRTELHPQLRFVQASSIPPHHVLRAQNGREMKI